MTFRMGEFIAFAALTGAANAALPQQPFDLDTSFATIINQQGVGSIAVLDDGDLLVSGDIHFGGSLDGWLLARLDPNGTRDTDWPDVSPPGGGKLVPWNNRYYVGVGQGIKRVWPDGNTDLTFTSLELDPYIHLLQGGDYHVFPDGRLLITGTHELTDTVRGFVGLYNLIWITPEGRLDTTRIHRKCNGGLSHLLELPDGKFMIGGGLTMYEGHPAGNIIRVHPDGALDTTFQSTASWFWPVCFQPLPDGKVVCGGDVVFSGSEDTLHVFRLLPDGSLDPTFNNALAMWRTYDMDGKAVVSSITPFGPDRYIVTGAFDRVEGQFRGGIAVIDTTGYLLDEPIGAAGCGTYTYMGDPIGFIVGIEEAPDGSYYVFGAYHGYDDGTNNDESQRMVSRLYGLDVGLHEELKAKPVLELYPNPAATWVQVSWAGAEAPVELNVRDVTGRLVRSIPVRSISPLEVEVQCLLPGVYVLSARYADALVVSNRLTIER